jgi:hypothetical protein
MSKQTSFYLPVGANNQSITLTSADTTTLKTCFTAATEDSDVKSIIATTDDSAIINLRLYVTRSSVDYLLGTVRLAALSGSDGAVNGVDLLNGIAMPGLPADNIGKRYIPLKSGDTLKVACVASMTAAKTCWVSVFGQNY